MHVSRGADDNSQTATATATATGWSGWGAGAAVAREEDERLDRLRKQRLEQQKWKVCAQFENV